MFYLMLTLKYAILRTFALIVSAHPYCARKFTFHVMHRAHALSTEMIGQMATAIALLGLNDLGCSVTPTFLFRNRFYLQLSQHCPKMNKTSRWEVKKTGHGINVKNENLRKKVLKPMCRSS